MSLEFADFAHYYAGSHLTEGQQRANFEVYASILESLVQLFWDDDPGQNRLGINFDLATMSRDNELESEGSLQSVFNCAACSKVARKKDS